MQRRKQSQHQSYLSNQFKQIKISDSPCFDHFSRILDRLFSDASLYKIHKLRNLVLQNDKGYVDIEQLLELEVIREALTFAEIPFDKMGKGRLKCMINIAVKTNSKFLKSNGNKIRRIFPFTDEKLRREKPLYLDLNKKASIEDIQRMFSDVPGVLCINYISKVCMFEVFCEDKSKIKDYCRWYATERSAQTYNQSNSLIQLEGREKMEIQKQEQSMDHIQVQNRPLPSWRKQPSILHTNAWEQKCRIEQALKIHDFERMLVELYDSEHYRINKGQIIKDAEQELNFMEYSNPDQIRTNGSRLQMPSQQNFFASNMNSTQQLQTGQFYNDYTNHKSIVSSLRKLKADYKGLGRSRRYPRELKQKYQQKYKEKLNDMLCVASPNLKANQFYLSEHITKSKQSELQQHKSLDTSKNYDQHRKEFDQDSNEIDLWMKNILKKSFEQCPQPNSQKMEIYQ